MLLNIRVRCFFISFRDKSQDKSIKEFETNDARNSVGKLCGEDACLFGCFVIQIYSNACIEYVWNPYGDDRWQIGIDCKRG